MLKMHKIKQVSHVVVFPILFMLFYDQYWERGVLELLKNSRFFSIFSCYRLFPQVFGQVNE